MSHYRRFFVPGATYFFTIVAWRRRPILATPLARDSLRRAFRIVRGRHPFSIVALVLLPDHLHTVWTMPRGDCDYSLRWRRIKEEFTRYFMESGGNEIAPTVSRSSRGERGIWQRRFWEHLCRDEEDLKSHCDYIHYNPVKHGLAKSPVDWPWSSFHRFVRRGEYEEKWGSIEPLGLRFDKLQTTAMK